MPIPRAARAVVLSVSLLLALAAGASAQEVADDAALRGYQSATGLLSRGMNDLAVREYRAFLKDHPTHARAPAAKYGLGVALARLNRHEEAAGVLEGLERARGFEFAPEAGVLRAQSLMAASKFADAAATLASTVERHSGHDLADDATALLAECRHRAGEHAKVEPARAALEAGWPQSPLRDRAEYFAGLALIALEKDSAAAQRLGGLAKQWPRSPLAPQAALLGAQCAQRAGDSGLAEDLYERAGTGGAAPAEARLGAASLKRAAGKLDEAREALDRLIAEAGDKAPAGALLERGRILLELGQHGPALKDFERYAGAPGADKAAAAYWIARSHLKAGEPKEAAAQLRAGLRAEPTGEMRPLLAFDLGAALLQAGDEEAASAALGEFRTRHASHEQAPAATEALATLRHRQGKYAESEAICEEFRRDFPKHALTPRIDFVSAENAFLGGDMTRAIRGYKAYLTRHPAEAGGETGALAKFRLGCAYFRDGSGAKARPLLEEAAARAPQSPTFRPALLYLGDIAFQAGQWAEAETRLRAYLALGADLPAADDALLKLGIALRRQGREADAPEPLRRLLNDHPNSPHRPLATLELGRALLAAGSEEEGMQRLREAAAGPDKDLAAIAQTQLGSMAAGSGDSESAARAFRAAAGGSGESAAEALLGLGSVLAGAGKHGEAVEAFDRFLRDHASHPRAGEARARRALANARLSQDDSTLTDLEGALAQGDLSADLRAALAYERTACLRKLGRSEDAERAARELLASTRDPVLRVHAALDVARSHFDAKRYAEAASLLREVEKDLANPALPGAVRENAAYQRAACEYRLERPREAAALFEAFLRAHPESPLFASASLLAGECLHQARQPQRAVEHLRRALEKGLGEPDEQVARLRLGDALAASQDWPASEQTFAAFLEKFARSDQWFQARFGRGWALENQGRHDDAIAEYRRITERHQGSTAARAQFQIGECLFAQGRHEDAAAELLKVDILYAYPEWSAAALYEAGRCFEALGNREQAAEQFRLVREKHPQSRWAEMAGKKLASGESGGNRREP
ncbi:MAG: tetratricopeptide repeat protein [Phycisphaerales bacterium]